MSVQFYSTSSVYCIVCLPPKVKPPSITIYSPFTLLCLTQPPFFLVITKLLSMSMSYVKTHCKYKCKGPDRLKQSNGERYTLLTLIKIKPV